MNLLDRWSIAAGSGLCMSCLALVAWLEQAPGGIQRCPADPVVLKPRCRGVERCLWVLEPDAVSVEDEPRLKMDAQEVSVDCSQPARIREDWMSWHCSWLESKEAEIRVHGERASFFPQQVQLTTGPVQLIRQPNAAARHRSEDILPVEVECAEFVLDLSPSAQLPSP